MDSRERVGTALHLGKPDRVPLCELVIDDGLIREMTGKKKIDIKERIEFRENLGIDAVCVSPRLEKEFAGAAGAPVDLEKAVAEYTGIKHDISHLERYHRQSGLFVFALLDGSMGELSSIAGFEQLMISMVRSPGQVKAGLEKLGEKHLEIVEDAAAKGAGAVILGDDIAYSQGPVVSPEKLRELVFPVWEKEIKEIKRLGLPVIFHSEGNLELLLPDLVSMFDGLHSLEPASGMSLRKLKERYGHRVCLAGNVSLEHLSGTEPPEKLREVVKNTIEAGAPGGGYIFGTSGGLYSGLDPEAVLSMFFFGREYGKYY